MAWVPGRHCWVVDADRAFVEGTLSAVDGQKATVSIVGPGQPAGTQRVCLLDDLMARVPDQACVADMDDLQQLHTASVLNNLEMLFSAHQSATPGEGPCTIYSSVGPVLIAMNPFTELPIYGEKWLQAYLAASGDARANKRLGPHCYRTVEEVYSNLGATRRQSVVICGESGAGKTVTNRKMIEYLCQAQRSTSASPGSGGSITDTSKITEANALLESFGNAKTTRNDNSSRFGKFMEIEFDTMGKIQSAKISNYLLEKCRIVQQQPGERGYHAFYQLCAGVSTLPNGADLGINSAYDHAYTLGLTEVPGVDDMTDFQEMFDCMGSLGFSTEERDSVFKIVAAVLHLGDLEFEEPRGANEGCKVAAGLRPEQISSLLHVELKNFNKTFQFKTLEDPFTKKVIDMPQDVTGASNARHSMAKVIYSRLFDWLVWKINQGTLRKGARECRKIGILDIYGFEVFDWNSFEQLCINFANEKLQQHFNSHMFTLEQQLYTDEGISWAHITWQDNREIIDSLEKRPLGLFCILDSECITPNATDASGLSKIYSAFKTSKIITKPSRFASTQFAVAHYAGEVVYDIVSFLEKNTDKLHNDIMVLLKGSSMPLIKTLFTDPKFAPEAAPAGAAAGAGGARPGGPTPKTRSAPGAAARPGAGGGDGGRAKQNVTVSMVFRQQLDKLVDDLNQTNPRYIRCIKPNPNKQAHEFDSVDVQRQLRCAGMLESIRIRRAGYSVRRQFKEFFNRFRVLTPQLSTGGRPDPDYKDLSRKLLEAIEEQLRKEKEPLDARPWQIGRSKVFLKEELQKALESRISSALSRYVVKIQKTWRGFRMRKRYREMKKAAVIFQATLRSVVSAKEFRTTLNQKNASVEMQAALRTVVLRRIFLRQRTSVVKVQKVYRGWKCRSKVGKLKGKMAEDRIRKMREEEAREDAFRLVKQQAAEKEKEMAQMHKQLELERERAKEEARKMYEERQKGAAAEELEVVRRQQAQQAQQAAAETEMASKLKQEMLELRKENARLEGQLGSQSAPESRGGSASAAEVEHLRRELQDLRREKVRLEVQCTTSKSPEEYEAMVAEISNVREELSALRRSKIDSDLQLEQTQAKLGIVQTQAARAEHAAVEIDVLKQSNEEMQVLIQRLQAQKSALEERSQADESVRKEVRELRLEKMRIEGELETSKMREEAISERYKSAERGSAEMHQQRQKLVTAEVELDAARKQIERLREQVTALNAESSTMRTGSLDQLRSELLSRIEAKPVTLGERTSIGPGMDPSSFGGDAGEFGRKSIVDQRAMFEKLKQQFNDASAGGIAEDESHLDESTGGARELELEEEIRQVRKENVELNIRITSLTDELQAKDNEAAYHLRSSAVVQAELEDLKFQLDSEASSGRRNAVESAALQERILEVQAELTSTRSRLNDAEERVVRTEEDYRSTEMRLKNTMREFESVEKRVQELQRQCSEATNHERALEAQVEEQREKAEQYRKFAENSERTRVESSTSAQWLESENERLRAELDNARAESVKIKEVVDELVRAEGQSRSEELEKEINKWKTRATYFEREYSRSKELNTEMTNQMSQMMNHVSERTDQSGDLSQQNRALKKQIEGKIQELKMARLEKEDTQRQLDSLQSTGSYFQDKYREASTELRTLKQEHSVASATAAKLKLRVESLQKECDDLKAQCTKLSMEARSGGSDASRVSKYEEHVRSLEAKIRTKESDVEDVKERFAKSQAVNDCLNTLLVLESEQASIYESAGPLQDEHMREELQSKKMKASNVIGRLNEMLNDDERASIDVLTQQRPPQLSRQKSGTGHLAGQNQLDMSQRGGQLDMSMRAQLDMSLRGQLDMTQRSQGQQLDTTQRGLSGAGGSGYPARGGGSDQYGSGQSRYGGGMR
eukprot:TRINITY_DN6450_c0_g3_i1.p1 TRINITY_DN6450_c0_g3~~TRINITY_DN6450_c0_g3_i1.p1  ORF type:complete len:1904 (+),score=486.14 TRINITY_DN6450_c0_g3_i1:65-5713(+)